MNFSHQNRLMSFFCGYYLSDNSIKMLQKGPAPHFSEVMNSRQMCPVTGSYSKTLSDQPCPQLWVSPLSRPAQTVSLPPSTHSSLTRAKWSTEDATEHQRSSERMLFTDYTALSSWTSQQHHHHIRLWYNDWLCLQRFWDWKTKEQRRRPGPLCISGANVVISLSRAKHVFWQTLQTAETKNKQTQEHLSQHHSDPQDAPRDSDHNQDQYSNYWKKSTVKHYIISNTPSPSMIASYVITLFY